MKIIVCSKCGGHNPETAELCGYCGGMLSMNNIVELNDNLAHSVADSPESPPVINEPIIPKPPIPEPIIPNPPIPEPPIQPAIQKPSWSPIPVPSTWHRLWTSCLVYWIIMACLVNLILYIAMSGSGEFNIGYVLIATLLGPVTLLPFWAWGYLWLWPLIDCIKNEPSGGNEKILWILIIIFLNFLGGILYLLIRRGERIRVYGE